MASAKLRILFSIPLKNRYNPFVTVVVAGAYSAACNHKQNLQ
jgi:hypothetical protein